MQEEKEKFERKESELEDLENSYSSQQKLGIEIELYQQKHWQFGLKGIEMEQKGVRLLAFWDSTGWDKRAIWLYTCIIFQEKWRMTPERIQRSTGLPFLPQAQRA